MERLLPSIGLLTACTPHGALVDAPISGGTDEVQGAIRAELAAFDEATGFDRTRVSRVVVKDLGDRKGRFNLTTHSVLLDDDLDEVSVIEVLRHELCHSLNRRERLHEDQAAVYERLAQGVFASDFVGHSRGCKTEECQQDEVFAAYCQLGPWVAHALAQECPGDPEDGHAALRQMARDLWIEAEPVLPTTPMPEWASLEFDDPEDYVRAWGTSSPLIFDLSVYTSTGYMGGFRYIHTGEIAPGDVEIPETPDEPPDGLPLELWNFELRDDEPLTRGPVGETTGPYAATIEVELVDLGNVLRHVWYDGERWWLAGDGCVDRHVEPFIAADQVFTLRVDGNRVGWGPVAP